MVFAGHHFYLVTLYIGLSMDYLTPENKFFIFYQKHIDMQQKRRREQPVASFVIVV